MNVAGRVEEAIDVVDALCHNDPELAQVRPNRIYDLRPLPNQKIPRLVIEQRRLPVRRLHWYEAHRWSSDSLAYRLRINRVSLPALHIRLDVLRRHQAHRMTEPGELSCPEMILLVTLR